MKWEKVKLKDICVSITDGTHQAPPKTDFGIPFITIANITGFNKIDFFNTNFVTKEYYETQDEKRTAKPNGSRFVWYSCIYKRGCTFCISATYSNTKD